EPAFHLCPVGSGQVARRYFRRKGLGETHFHHATLVFSFPFRLALRLAFRFAAFFRDRLPLQHLLRLFHVPSLQGTFPRGVTVGQLGKHQCQPAVVRAAPLIRLRLGQLFPPGTYTRFAASPPQPH